MDYLPLFFKLQGEPCLLVGGGTIALRKARLLTKAGARVTLVAPQVSAELEALIHQYGGTVVVREYQTTDIDFKRLVVSATDVEEVNRAIAEDCKLKNIPVNVVDNPSLCSVIMPAIVDRSPLMIAISSGGEAPVLARMVRAKIESIVPAAYGRLAQFASRYRDAAKCAFNDGDLRRRFWESQLAGTVAEQVLAGNDDSAAQTIEEQLAQKTVTRTGEVYLVGAGPGDPDLLTFKALRLMQQAEVVLYDRLVSDPIMELVRRDADRIYVGKRKSSHTMAQTDINQLLVDLAQQGKRVLRLKGGDPFIFGRGGEEIELLAARNIPFQVVPGITAASGCASYAGIPLTHRDHAHSVRFATGHLKAGASALNWSELAGEGQTLVFYMGLSGIDTICQALIAAGKAESTPAALIERGTTPQQKVHIKTLANLPAHVASTDIHAPTLLIVGTVVTLHDHLRWYTGD